MREWLPSLCVHVMDKIRVAKFTNWSHVASDVFTIFYLYKVRVAKIRNWWNVALNVFKIFVKQVQTLLTWDNTHTFLYETATDFQFNGCQTQDIIVTISNLDKYIISSIWLTCMHRKIHCPIINAWRALSRFTFPSEQIIKAIKSFHGMLYHGNRENGWLLSWWQNLEKNIVYVAFGF